MGGLISQLDVLIRNYERDYGWAKYILIGSAEAQVLSYEIAIKNGLPEEDAILKEYDRYGALYICRINDESFKEIVIK